MADMRTALIKNEGIHNPTDLHVYENVVAERVNGILKGGFDIDIGSGSLKEARADIAQSINIYNNKRRHL